MVIVVSIEYTKRKETRGVCVILSALLCLRLYVVCFCLSRESHNVLCSSPAMLCEKRVHGWTFSPSNPLCSPYDSLECSSLCLCGIPKPHSPL